MYRLATLILLTIVVAAFPALAQVSVEDPALVGGEASFEGLGDLSGGEFYSRAYAVSADGSVVVGEGESSRGTEAFRWENGVMEGLGDLEDEEEDEFVSRAWDVSADGAVVVGTGYSIFWDIFRWEDGVMEGLGDLESGLWTQFAERASSDGAIVVGLCANLVSGNNEACRWEDGNIEGLGFLGDGTDSRAHGVSADGTVVVGRSNRKNGGRGEAFRWEDGTMEGLGFLEGAEASRADDVSADGRVVVGRNNFYNPFQWEAFRWEDGVMEGLGDLHGPLSGSVPHAVSADGSVIVGEAGYYSEDGVRAFIWTEEEGMRYLHEVLENDYDLDITGWLLRRAYDVTVTSDGTVVVVGHSINPEGNSEAFRAVLPSFIVADDASPEALADVLSTPDPNPTRGASTITLAVERGQYVAVEVFDVIGRRVQTLYNDALAGGMSETLTLDASGLPAGTYIVRATGEDFVKSQNVTVIR